MRILNHAATKTKTMSHHHLKILIRIFSSVYIHKFTFFVSPTGFTVSTSLVNDDPSQYRAFTWFQLYKSVEEYIL